MTKSVARILGFGFIIGMLIMGYSLYRSKQEQKTLKVVGYANKQFVSDLVKWNLSVQKTAYLETLKTSYKSLATDINEYKQHLIKNGIEEKEISIQPITSYPMYDNYGKISSYNLVQNIFIITGKIDKIEELALNPDFFADKGLLLQTSNLSYLYTKLPELKKQLLADATTDAMERAREIASAAKVKLGKVREARAGVFQITEPYSTDVSDYGIYNTNTRNKSISVTLSSIFTIK